MKAPVRRLALVGPLPPPYGGMANQTRQLARLLEDEGITVEIVQSNAPYRPAWIGRVPTVRAGFRLVPYLAALWRAAGRNPLFHVMANSGWSWHLFAAPAVWIASLRGRAVVLNYRGGEAEAFFRRSFRWVAPTLRRCHEIVVPSRFLQQIFGRFRVAVTVVPNVVDLTRFQGERDASEAGPNLIVTRNLEAIYGIDTAIRAFASLAGRYPAARLWIAGSGPLRDELEAQVRDLGLEGRVIFTGRLPPEEVAALYRRADVLVNPSRVDNAPNALLEAMAAGVPIVSTRAGGVPYLVEDGETALLVPVDDPTALAEAVARVLDDDGLRQVLVDAGRRQVRAHRWEAVRARLFDSYARALRAAGGRRNDAPA